MQVNTATAPAADDPSALPQTRLPVWLVRMLRNPSALVLLFAVLGGTFRVGQYLSHRSFWHDEAFIILNIQDKTPRQLLGSLEHDQAAPPLFLLAQKSLVTWLGQSEFVFRLMPLLLALGGLAIFARLALTAAPAAAPWAVAMLAFSDKLIWHAAEAKQYSGDIFIGVLILYFGLGLPRVPVMVRVGMVSVLSAAALWFSHPAVFVFGGVSLALLPEVARHWRRRIAPYVAMNLLVAVSLALVYGYSIRLQQTEFLREHWASRFPDWSKALLVPGWVVKQVYLFCNHAYEPMGALMLGLAAAGMMALWKARAWESLGAFAGPIVLTLGAAFFQRYPFGGSRVTVFLLPGLFMLAAFGVEHLRQNLPTDYRRWWWLAPAPFLAAGLGNGGYFLICPRTASHIRPVVEYVREHRQAGEAIYIAAEGRPNRSLELFCYWRPDPPIFTDLQRGQGIESRRFWIVIPFLPAHGVRPMQGVLDYASSLARQRDSYQVTGGAAFLFEQVSPSQTQTGDEVRAVAGGR